MLGELKSRTFVVLLFLRSLSLYSFLLPAAFFVALFLKFWFGSRRLVSSVLLTQGCSLFIISFGSFSP